MLLRYCPHFAQPFTSGSVSCSSRLAYTGNGAYWEADHAKDTCRFSGNAPEADQNSS